MPFYSLSLYLSHFFCQSWKILQWSPIDSIDSMVISPDCYLEMLISLHLSVCQSVSVSVAVSTHPLIQMLAHSVRFQANMCARKSTFIQKHNFVLRIGTASNISLETNERERDEQNKQRKRLIHYVKWPYFNEYFVDLHIFFPSPKQTRLLAQFAIFSTTQTWLWQQKKMYSMKTKYEYLSPSQLFIGMWIWERFWKTANAQNRNAETRFDPVVDFNFKWKTQILSNYYFRW